MAKRYDLTDLFLNRQLRKDEGIISKWGSKAAGRGKIGGGIGGLIGKYALPIALGVLSGGALAGPALLAAQAGGGLLGSYIGGQIGHGSAGDMPETEFLTGTRADVQDTLQNAITTDAGMTGIKTLGAGITKGSDAVAKDVYKPVQWLRNKIGSPVDPNSLAYSNAAGGNITVPTYVPPGASGTPIPGTPLLGPPTPYAFHPDQVADHTQTGFESYAKNNKWLPGNWGSFSKSLDDLYNPGGYIGLDTTSADAIYTSEDMNMLMQGGLDEKNPYWKTLAERLGVTPEKARTDALASLSWQNVKKTPMEELLAQYGINQNMLSGFGGGGGMGGLMQMLLQQLMKKDD